LACCNGPCAGGLNLRAMRFGNCHKIRHTGFSAMFGAPIPAIFRDQLCPEMLGKRQPKR
jgi:hypothetical protein